MQNVVDSLSPEAFDQLAAAVHKRRRRESLEQAATITLNHHEISLVGEGQHINAIKALRERLNLSLMVAKDAVDMFRDRSRSEPLSSWEYDPHYP